MQRDRNDEVWTVILHESAHTFQGQERQRRAQPCLSVVLEGMDQVAYRPFIEKTCPGSVEMGGMGQACAATVVAAGSGKGNPAKGAER